MIHYLIVKEDFYSDAQLKKQKQHRPGFHTE